MSQNMDYPALYHSSEELSSQSQRSFFIALYLHLFFLVVAAVISVINSASQWMAICQAMTLLGALGCSIYLFSARPDRYWYGGRAVAESIKTISWRFVTKAEPFNRSDNEDRDQFIETLRSIVKQNQEVAQRLNSFLRAPQIPEAMMEMRRLPAKDRLANYIKHRIDDQLAWYDSKAGFNRRKARNFFGLLIATNALAILFAIAKVRYPSAPYWPTDALIALAASILSWVQAKRFSELSSSYALAAQEIGLVKEQAVGKETDDALSKFVGDSENAFSREHTQWIARKDT